MSRLFLVEDDKHADWISKWSTRAEAQAELERLASISWDEEPNRCPCGSWRTCGRWYQIVEFDTTGPDWREVNRERLLDVGSKGVKWLR